jgi:hypothetical protein
MKERKNDITDMQKLAETGWKQMHETLVQRGLSSDVSVLSPSSKKRNLFLFIAACIFSVLIFSYPFILNDHSFLSLNSNNKTENSSKESFHPAPSENKSAENNAHSLTVTPEQKLVLHQKINQQFSQFKKENFISNLQFEKAYLSKKFFIERNCKAAILQSDNPIDTAIKFERTNSLQKKSESPVCKKTQIFAGAGVNISAGNNHSNSFFNDLNIHPGITVIVPLSNKLSLHTGLWALSTIHGKEASAKEKELVNNFNSNIYYNIKTTSIIKASYFDVPLTLHYSINKNWSVGTGLQLSKLYKVNIKEQKQSFDYNNTPFSTSVQQFNSTPARAAAAFQKKVEIKKFESRLVAETNFETGKFLFTGGYFYGLGKTISLKDAVNSSHQYRNVYFKLGIQYRIK